MEIEFENKLERLYERKFTLNHIIMSNNEDLNLQKRQTNVNLNNYKNNQFLNSLNKDNSYKTWENILAQIKFIYYDRKQNKNRKSAFSNEISRICQNTIKEKENKEIIQNSLKKLIELKLSKFSNYVENKKNNIIIDELKNNFSNYKSTIYDEDKENWTILELANVLTKTKKNKYLELLNSNEIFKDVNRKNLDIAQQRKKKIMLNNSKIKKITTSSNFSEFINFFLFKNDEESYRENFKTSIGKNPFVPIELNQIPIISYTGNLNENKTFIKNEDYLQNIFKYIENGIEYLILSNLKDLNLTEILPNKYSDKLFILNKIKNNLNKDNLIILEKNEMNINVRIFNGLNDELLNGIPDSIKYNPVLLFHLNKALEIFGNRWNDILSYINDYYFNSRTKISIKILIPLCVLITYLKGKKILDNTIVSNSNFNLEILKYFDNNYKKDGNYNQEFEKFMREIKVKNYFENHKEYWYNKRVVEFVKKNNENDPINKENKIKLNKKELIKKNVKNFVFKKTDKKFLINNNRDADFYNKNNLDSNLNKFWKKEFEENDLIKYINNLKNSYKKITPKNNC